MTLEYAPSFDLAAGDLIVHRRRGVGIYRGLTRMHAPVMEGAGPIEKEYLIVEYEGGDKLYVPVDQVDQVRRYVGAEGAPPPLSRLNGEAWAHAVARAREQAAETAAHLIDAYAEREAAAGHAYEPDTDQMRAMEAAFPYAETPGQIAAIEDVKRDLGAPRPMDRLIVGDVGYGKTEVAIRAAFKVASEGRQVAVLCPTSVLAAQHHANFRDRLADFPVRVEALSRLRTPKDQQEVLAGLRAGDVHIVIGTHRLLSPDVEYRDLGLFIVDEEQRFGVAHKETMKEMRKSVDALAMTATPIPRTMQLALTGMRDVSLINDPPHGRIPVETIVEEYSDDRAREAIRREVDRGGQVYFLHNHVETLPSVTEHLAALLPDVRFQAAHGQMGEEALEQTMLDFSDHRFEVLVCTTIIEAGVDIPNANTMIVDGANHLGLAQLYQLRGRVGRSPTPAYAYLLTRKDAAMSGVAEQRLAALKEHSELGSGYQIALRDLELRGAGSLLGVEQSGPVAAVGFDLFMGFLEQATSKARGLPPNPRYVTLPAVDLPVDTGIPASAMPDDAERMRLYHKLASVRGRADIDCLKEEFEERLGGLPPTVQNALALADLRLRCHNAAVKTIATEGPLIHLQLRHGTQTPPPVALALEAEGHSVEGDKILLRGVSDDSLNAVGEVVKLLATAFRGNRSGDA